MAIYKVQGSSLAIGSAFGATKAMSAVSNAAEAVATLEAAHGIAVNELFHVVSSGWQRMNDRVFRAKAVATNDVTVEGFNTTSTSDYPAGEGVGTVREISTWTPITQLLSDISSSGGGFRKSEVTQLNDIRVRQITTLAEAVVLQFKFHFDPALPWYNTVLAAARSGNSFPYRITYPSGAKEYGSAIWGMNSQGVPENGVLVGTLDLDVQSDSTIYLT